MKGPVHDARMAPEEIGKDTEALLTSEVSISPSGSVGEKSIGDTISKDGDGGNAFPASIKYIVGNEFCERFCYYGMRTVLILYMTCPLQLEQSSAIMINHAFIALAYFTPLAGGALSDGYLGKYSTIFYLSLVYAFGSTVLSLTSTTHSPNALKFTGLMVGLLLIATGTGGIKPCVSAFGGDQFKGRNAATQLQSFFAIFYFAINAGSVLSIIITPLLREYGCPECGGSSCSFSLAFGVPAALMIVSIIILVAGRARVGYKMVPPKKQGLVKRIIDTRFAKGTPRFGGKVDNDNNSGLLDDGNDEEKKVGESVGDIGEKNSSTTAANTNDKNDENTTNQDQGWYSRAVAQYGKAQADESKQVLDVLWVMTPFPLFWCLFDQQSSTWVIQASQMDGQLGKITILPDQMQMFNALLILVFLPIFDRGVYPAFRNCGLAMSPLSRMMSGMGLASIAFILAGFLQLKIDSCEGKCVNMLWQVPQYALITAGEVLFSVTGLEFAYSQAPQSMKAMMQSVWLLTVCLGNILVVAFEAISSAVGISMALGFFLNSGLMMAALVWFRWVSSGYTYLPTQRDA